MRTVLLCLLSVCAFAGTRIKDTLYLPNGQKANGFVTITWPTFNADGREIPGNPKGLDIPIRNGVLDVNLEATEPSNTAYFVKYSWANGGVANQFWSVKTSATPLPVAAVRVAYGGSGRAAWGSITGNLSDQTDLTGALNSKEPAIPAGTNLQFWRGDKTWQPFSSLSINWNQILSPPTFFQTVGYGLLATGAQVAADDAELASYQRGSTDPSGTAPAGRFHVRAGPETLWFGDGTQWRAIGIDWSRVLNRPSSILQTSGYGLVTVGSEVSADDSELASFQQSTSDPVGAGQVGRFHVNTNTGDVLFGDGAQWIGFARRTHQHVAADISDFGSITRQLVSGASGRIVYNSTTGIFDLMSGLATPGSCAKPLVDTYGRVTSCGTLLASEIPVLDSAKVTTGTFPIARGGTGHATVATNEVLIGNDTGGFTRTVIPDCAGTFNKLLYNATTRVFSCAADQTGGGGGGSSPLTTKGDIYTHDALVDARLPVGGDKQVLTADSSQATGLRWAERPIGVLPTGTNAGIGSTNTAYVCPPDTGSSTTETFRSCFMPFDGTIKHVRGILKAAQAAGGALTCTLRVDGTNTPIVLAWAASAPGGTIQVDTTNSVTATEGQLLSWSCNNAGSANSATFGITLPIYP